METVYKSLAYKIECIEIMYTLTPKEWISCCDYWSKNKSNLSYIECFSKWCKENNI